VNKAATAQFVNVTEIAGEEITQEQFERLCHRYYWAGEYALGRDVLEVACGSGPGLRYLASKARSLKAGDFSPEVLARAKQHVSDQIELKVFDAQSMPYADASFDVVLIFEALYYVPSADRFVSEARRVLRPDGVLLIANANKDLYDFNRSPYSTTYHGVVELRQLLVRAGFQPSFLGYLAVEQLSARQRLLRPLKKLAVGLNLMPKTMAGKRLLKRLVFGRVLPMPADLGEGMIEYRPADAIAAEQPDQRHKVLYCIARRT
jgi:ubiquinone/menaquinone biosynthesis C-methylase UbiE